MIRKSALAVTVAALLSPGLAAALGLGNIEVTSALNEPFRARIPVQGAKPGELEELRATLGDPDQFARAGLDRAFVLTKLKFRTVERSGSRGFIELSTREPVAEPFLNFLVDVSWSRGRVLREFTVLLDPPVYGAAIRSATTAQVQTVDSLPVTAPAPAMPAARSMAPAPAPAMSAPARPAYAGDSYGPVRRGETLWSIADRVRPAGTSIQSMMLALLNANPDSFNINNINALKSGVVLRIPKASEVQQSRAEALAEVTRQHALWAEYRQTLTAKVPATPAGTSATTAATTTSGETTASATGAAATAGSETSGELKLVGGASAGAGGGADVQSLRDELTVAQEEADAARSENEELKSRLGDAESLVDDLKRLVEIKEDQLAALQNQLATGQMPTSEAPASESAADQGQPVTTTESSEATTSTTTETQPPAATTESATPAPVEKKAKKKRKVTPAPKPSSFLDDINDLLPVPLWSILAALGALLVAIGGVRFARSRKAAQDSSGAVAGAAAATAAGAGTASMLDEFDGTGTLIDDNLDGGDVTQVPDEPVGAASADQDAATIMGDTAPDFSDTPGGDTHVEELDDDPLAEVNVYLAYERFEQAEELVRDAIGSYPEREDYRLKLVEVFYASKDAAKFEPAAQDLSDAAGADHPMMDQVREWWEEMGTGRALFGAIASGPATASEDDSFTLTGAEADGEETGVDFDLTFETTDDTGEPSSVDFEIGGTSGDGDDTDAGKGSEVDFDLGGLAVAGAAATAAATVAAAVSDDDQAAESGVDTGLDFDLGSIDADETATALADDALGASSLVDDGAGGETGLDFDLGGMDLEDTVTARPPGLPAAGDTAAMGEETGLDFDSDAAPAVDTSIGGGSSALDFDLGSVSGAGTDDGSPLDFDLGDTESTTAGEGAVGGSSGAGSALDFDLDATQPAGAGSALDFDLGAGDAGESSALDFDLGSSDPSSSGSALDFDLGDTDALSETVRADDVAGAGTDSALELPMGEASGDLGAGDGVDNGDTQPFLQSPAAEADGDLDLDLSEGDTGPLRAGGDALDLDLGLDEPGAASGTGLDLPDLHFDTLEMDTTPEGAIDTVKLKAQQAAVAGIEAVSNGESAGVDTEFRDIFGAGTGAGSEVGTQSGLDLDFSEGGDDFISADSSIESDEPSMPDTEFMLPEGVGGGTDDDEGGLLASGGDEMQTKLDLAQAYIDMGDVEGARNLLGEVVSGGSDEQKSAASSMLEGLA